MSGSDKTTLGDRIKSYELASTSRKAFKGQPLIARLDGKSFHNFCKGLSRPYDVRLSELMVASTTYLVDRFNATVGYTQSDEITLAWFSDSTSKSEYVFDGRFQKLDSLLAAACTAIFNLKLGVYLPEKIDELPIFDCRSFVVPNLLEAYHAILWRQQDCTKNAISMAAQSMFSHKSLQGLHGPEMQEKMWAEKGVNFNDYPPAFKRGTFVQRTKIMAPLEPAVVKMLEARGLPVPGEVERTKIEARDLWLSKIKDPVSVLFKGAVPEDL